MVWELPVLRELMQVPMLMLLSVQRSKADGRFCQLEFVMLSVLLKGPV